MATTYLFIDGGYLKKIHADAMSAVFGETPDINFYPIPAFLSSFIPTGASISRSFYYDCIDEVRKGGED